MESGWNVLVWLVGVVSRRWVGHAMFYLRSVLNDVIIITLDPAKYSIKGALDPFN